MIILVSVITIVFISIGIFIIRKDIKKMDEIVDRAHIMKNDTIEEVFDVLEEYPDKEISEEEMIIEEVVNKYINDTSTTNRTYKRKSRNKKKRMKKFEKRQYDMKKQEREEKKKKRLG